MELQLGVLLFEHSRTSTSMPLLMILEQSNEAQNQATKLYQTPRITRKRRSVGRFRRFGGQYICETLETAFAGLEQFSTDRV